MGRWSRLSRLLPGDVAAPRLGWDAAAWRAHAGAFDLIVHCAALTKFDAEPALAHAVNVVGTQNVVALAQAGRMRAGGTRLLHVSTAYVNGGLGGIVLEGDRPEGPFTNAYEASKARAELVVADAGLEAVIVRPSIVLGDWATGAVRSFGTFYYLLKVLAEGAGGADGGGAGGDVGSGAGGSCGGGDHGADRAIRGGGGGRVPSGVGGADADFGVRGDAVAVFGVGGAGIRGAEG